MPGPRTGSRSPPTWGNNDAFNLAIADPFPAYPDQNERDYQALADAVESGRLEAQTGL